MKPLAGSSAWSSSFGKLAGFLIACLATVAAAKDPRPAAGNGAELDARVRIAAANLEDALVVDCQLPGRLQKLGGYRTYLTPGRLVRLSAIECRTRGGEYTIADLASGTLSLQRWLPLAKQGDPEAQYYVARIHANGMDGVAVDYARAAEWYRKAADQGYASAMQELGFLYEQGLGVEKDPLLALDLQRKASGLGEELDYAWKITAAKEEAARQVAEISGQLEQANLELNTLRTELAASSEALLASRSALARSEAAVGSLRDELELAKQQGGVGDPARVRELEAQLAARQSELDQAKARSGALEADLAKRQSQLQASLADSQAASLELNQLLATTREETEALRARLAQAEQRLIRSQEELNQERLRFQQEAERFAAERGRLEKLQEAQQAKLAALQSQQQPQPEAPSPQQQALVTKMSAELQAHAAELEGRQRRIAALEGEALQLREEVQRMRAQRSREASSAAGEADRLRAALADAQSKLAGMRDELARLRTERAAERVALIQQRDQLQAALAAGQQARERDAAVLRAEIQAREAAIQAKEARIAALEQQLEEQTVMVASLPGGGAGGVAGNLQLRSPQPKGEPKLVSMIRQAKNAKLGNYHALIIGNSNYRFMSPLSTPARDAQAVAELLQERYGFRVRTLLDATAEDIMRALHDYTLDLTPADNLLIYYAGHGGTPEGPPERAFWLGVEAEPDTQIGYLSAENIRAKIKQMNAKHVLLVADSCFSGAITHPTTTVVGRGITERRFMLQVNRRARMVLTSGLDTPVIDTSGDRMHSVFAKYFLQVLRQNDTVLSGEMLSHQLSDRIRTESSRLGLEQTPTYSSLHDANHQFGDFFFVPAPLRVAAVGSGAVGS